MIYLYHYFDRRTGPFRNLSDLPQARAKDILDAIRAKQEGFASQRDGAYLARRTELEQLAREMFIKKGGKPIRTVPHYMVAEACPWLLTWYREADCMKIPITDFDTDTVSFTYGDMFPTFSPRVNDGREYRYKVYRYEEIVELIERYGLPQRWNEDGRYGPERYIEAQVWSDEPIERYIETHGQR